MDIPGSPLRGVPRHSRTRNICPAGNFEALREFLWLEGSSALLFPIFPPSRRVFPAGNGSGIFGSIPARLGPARTGFWDGSEGFGIPVAFQGLGGAPGCSTGIKSGNFSLKLPDPRPRLHPHPAPSHPRPAPGTPQAPIPRLFSCSGGRDFIPGSLPGGSGIVTAATSGSRQGEKRDAAHRDPREAAADPGWIPAGSAPHSPSSSRNGSPPSPAGAGPPTPGPRWPPSGSGALPDPSSSAKALREEKLRKTRDPAGRCPLLTSTAAAPAPAEFPPGSGARPLRRRSALPGAARGRR